MQPLFFGSSSRRLFGVHHAPEGGSRRSRAALLCYPVMQEYMGSHWAFRKLAAGLAREGFHVLRFDYSGTGDSAGEAESASVADWIEDVRTAAAELAELADVRSVSVVGFRLGAALAALAATTGLTVADLVLWEPVASGRAHVRDLRSGERGKWAITNDPLRPRAGELLGYPFPPELESSIGTIELSALGPLAAQRVHLFVARAEPHHRLLREQLRPESGDPTALHTVGTEPSGLDAAFLLSTAAQREIATVLAAGS